MLERRNIRSAAAKPKATAAAAPKAKTSGAKAAGGKPAAPKRRIDEMQEYIQRRAYELWEKRRAPDRTRSRRTGCKRKARSPGRAVSAPVCPDSPPIVQATRAARVARPPDLHGTEARRPAAPKRGVGQALRAAARRSGTA